MTSLAAVAEIAALVGHPARASMLNALMDGRSWTATDLAYAARVSASTASAHLGRLAAANLVTVTPQGRHRHYRLASGLVASMLERITLVAAVQAPPRRPPAGGHAALRLARTCYDHLAGRLGVALADAFVARGYAQLDEDGGTLTAAGADMLETMGIEIGGGRRPLCRPCLDWTERRFHLAGKLGAALCAHCFERGWTTRIRDSRAVAITPAGAEALERHFGIRLDPPGPLR
ncbi:MAG TPA: winged helix-turn-helix domain-containing protein [Microvirga sp.]|nr:winged helix-turn-helix domain-containing protein [Microvirga sp.]